MGRKWVIAIATFCFALGGVGTAAALNEECAVCHAQRVADVAASSHGALACQSCHEGAANHGGNMTLKTTVHFDLEMCGTCHIDQYLTYTYSDFFKTKYGGSPEKWAKINDFTHYNDIIDGYGFTKEYNEERGHDVMLQAHYDVTRGKYETCLQCKSTKLAYYWDSGKVLTIENDTVVQGGHMPTAITVPKGTTVTMATNRQGTYPNNHEVQVLVTLPNGTMYSSYTYPGATKDGTWTWSALYALTVNELANGSPTKPSGNGCNHCHNPHKVKRNGAGDLLGFRLIRKSLIDAIDRRGLNPYAAVIDKNANLENAPLSLDGGIALCGQCHVEYVCGKSSIDGIDRDFFPWAKVGDLEGIYQSTFNYNQDWVHGTGALSSPNWPPPSGPPYYNTPFPIGESLIKSQHPEAETYWGGRHYGNDARCYTCHMPKVTKNDGTSFTSHWIASPIKYMETASVGPFANQFGLNVDKSGIISPCGACHGGLLARMKTKAVSIQDGIYGQALTVEAALVDSLEAIKTAKDAKAAGQPGDPALLAAAIADHRSAHVRWENLVVSENSMGFHDPAAVGNELTNALNFAKSAKSKADSAYTPAPPTCTTPGAPQNLTAAAGKSGKTYFVNLTWAAGSPAPKAGGYRIYRGGTFRAAVGTATLTYKDSGLATKTTYSYVVKAWQDCDGNGAFDAGVDLESTASNTASATTP
jgi:formate-dependent nitrite reductase cytochrome c552 subunit